MIAKLVYMLCGITSLYCAFLLLRGYLRTQVRLLLWSGLCFLGFAGNNMVLYLDRIVFQSSDLTVWRVLPAFFGLAILLYGLIWDME